MAIPFWRYKDYSDDGCSIYECLNCYKEWEARTSPKYSEWKFCPYCGCVWEGEKEWDAEAKWNNKKGIPLEKDVRLLLPIFVVEKRFVPIDGSEPTEWELISKEMKSFFDAVYDLEFYSAQEANSEIFWSKEEYRINYEPCSSEVYKDLQWKDTETSNYVRKKWTQYKKNVSLIDKAWDRQVSIHSNKDKEI